MSLPTDFPTKKTSSRKRWPLVVITTAVVAAGLYYLFGFLPSQTVESADAQSSMQTAVIRRGDLVIRATGSGELIATTQLDVGFDVSARIESIHVAVGDHVEEGQLLATLEDDQLLSDLQSAERAYTELTSPLALLQAQQDVFDLEESVRVARNYLAYLISPEVLYWEERLDDAQAELADAQLAVEQSASEDAQQVIADLNKTIAYLEASLFAANEDYQDVYVPENFTEEECEGEGRDRVCWDVILPPGETTIQVAWNELYLYRQMLVEAQYYLAAITEGAVPDGATGDKIVAFEKALNTLHTAQQNLAAAELLAPISGTVMSIDFGIGDTASNASSITLADLTNPIMQVYLDESDWDNILMGYGAEIIFDAIPDRIFTGAVVQIDPFLTSQSGASMIGALVAMDIDNASALSSLPIGVSAAVDIIGGRAIDAILVPVEALREVTPGQYSVFVLENGEPKLRMVEIGIRDLFYAEVISGLSPGDVVTTGIVETQ